MLEIDAQPIASDPGADFASYTLMDIIEDAEHHAKLVELLNAILHADSTLLEPGTQFVLPESGSVISIDRYIGVAYDNEKKTSAVITIACRNSISTGYNVDLNGNAIDGKDGLPTARRFIFKSAYQIHCSLGQQNDLPYVVDKIVQQAPLKIMKLFLSKTPSKAMIEKSFTDGYEGNEHVQVIQEKEKNTLLLQGIIMPHRGKDLFECLSNGYLQDFSPEDVTLLTLDILGNLFWCHSRMIVHNDLKPGNITIFDLQKKLTALIDFGHAHHIFSEKYKHIAATLVYTRPLNRQYYHMQQTNNVTDEVRELVMNSGYEKDLFAVGVVIALLYISTSNTSIKDPKAYSEWIAATHKRVNQTFISFTSDAQYVEWLEGPMAAAIPSVIKIELKRLFCSKVENIKTLQETGKSKNLSLLYSVYSNIAKSVGLEPQSPASLNHLLPVEIGKDMKELIRAEPDSQNLSQLARPIKRGLTQPTQALEDTPSLDFLPCPMSDGVEENTGPGTSQQGTLNISGLVRLTIAADDDTDEEIEEVTNSPSQNLPVGRKRSHDDMDDENISPKQKEHSSPPHKKQCKVAAASSPRKYVEIPIANKQRSSPLQPLKRTEADAGQQENTPPWLKQKAAAACSPRSNINSPVAQKRKINPLQPVNLSALILANRAIGQP